MSSAAPLHDVAGCWAGTIEVPGVRLDIRVVLSPDEDGWTGVLEIPVQGLKGAPLEDFRIEPREGGEVGFRIAGVPGAPTFAGVWTGDQIQGTFSQGGHSFPFSLGRAVDEKVTSPPRPQEPQPPFPYVNEDVEYEGDGVTLAGTLTLPEAAGPHPAILLLSGSGSHDRDEQIFGHKPFLVLADHLTRAGIAVLRCDDRGVGGSSGNPGEATIDDLATDASHGVAYLAGRPEIDAGRVGLLGHSEGALVASLAAARDDHVAFVVQLCGSGVPGRELLPRQTRLLLEARGVPETIVRFHQTMLESLIDSALADASREDAKAKLRAVAETASAALPESESQLAATLLESLENQLPRFSGDWFRHFLNYDPRPTAKRLQVPVLAIAGDLDLQVPPDQSLPELEAALGESATDDVTLRRFPGLNHLLQSAESGSPIEYAAIEETMSPEVLEQVSGWLVERFAQKMK